MRGALTLCIIISTLLALPLISAQSNVHIILDIINDDFGTADESHFIIFVNGDRINNNNFISPAEAIVPVQSGPYEVIEYSQAVNYTISYNGCSGTLMEGENATCTITNDDPELILPGGELCYQEFADEGNRCGARGVGTYRVVNYTSNAYNDYWKDGVWTRNASLTAAGCITTYGESAQAGEYYVNYSKPKGALSSSVWKIKDFYGLSADADAISDFTYRIPTSCFNQEQLSFRTILPISPTACGVGSVEMIASCWNGKEWQTIRYTNSTDWAGVFEEAMIWGISDGNQTGGNDPNARAYYGNGVAFSEADGYALQTLWVKTNESDEISGGVLQIDTGHDAEVFNLARQPSPTNTIIFYIFPRKATNFSEAIGRLEMTRNPKSEVTVWEGGLWMEEAYKGSYKVIMGTKSVGIEDAERLSRLVEETKRFNPQDNFITYILKRIFD